MRMVRTLLVAFVGVALLGAACGGGGESTADKKAKITANWEAFTRHYNERVPTVEEEFQLWGAYHQHRHEMRYDLVGNAVRAHLPPGGVIVDSGCGSALVAEGKAVKVKGTWKVSQQSFCALIALGGGSC